MAKVKHIALLKFKPGTNDETIEQVFNELLDISEGIPGVEDYVCGPNCSPEGKNGGYSHAMIITFRDLEARDAFLPHPEHARFTEVLAPHVEDNLVVDFEVA